MTTQNSKNSFNLLAELKSLRHYDTRIWILFISRMLVVASFTMCMMFFSIYLHTELHVPLRVVGTIMMIAAAISALTMMIGGTLSDRLGRRPLMWVATVIRALIFLGIAWVIQTKPNVTVLTVLYICARILGGFYMPAADAMLADLVAPQHRAKAYGIMRIFANAGFAIGPAIGGMVAEISFAYLFGLSSIVSILAGIFILMFVKESLDVTQITKTKIKNMFSFNRDMKLFVFCLVSVLFFLVMGQFGVTLSIYSTEHVGISKAQLGRLFMTNGLMVLFFQYPISVFGDRVKAMRKLQIGMAVYALGFFLFGAAHSFMALAWYVVLITIGEMIFEPSANAVVANIAPINAKGRYMGVFGMTRSFGWSIAPFIGGLLLHSFLHQGLILWGVIGVIGLVAVLGYVVLERTVFRDTIARG